MACGTPVVTSRTSSMPEIAGPEAILIDPEKPGEIAGMLLRLERDDRFYRQQRETGLERARHFSWQKTAEELLKLYNDIQNV